MSRFSCCRPGARPVRHPAAFPLVARFAERLDVLDVVRASSRPGKDVVEFHRAGQQGVQPTSAAISVTILVGVAAPTMLGLHDAEEAVSVSSALLPIGGATFDQLVAPPRVRRGGYPWRDRLGSPFGRWTRRASTMPCTDEEKRPAEATLTAKPRGRPVTRQIKLDATPEQIAQACSRR